MDSIDKDQGINHQEDIFEDDSLAFISIFQHVCQRYNWVCHCCYLMRNHYDFLIETPNAIYLKACTSLLAFIHKHLTEIITG